MSSLIEIFDSPISKIVPITERTMFLKNLFALIVNINSELKKQSLKSKMLLQVHDELVFDVHKSEKDQIKDIVKTTMESAVKLKVPLKIDLEFGKNWLEAH